MELKTTEKFIKQVHGAACSTLKTKFEKEFPELFKTELKAGKWYKGNVDFDSLIFITEIENNGYYNRVYYYGFISNTYRKGDYIANRAHEASLKPANTEEIESYLIAEAKKKGFKKGVTCLFGFGKDKRSLQTDKFTWEGNTLGVKWNNGSTRDIIFKYGIWAEILPEEKTIITKEKALKIIAKKLKVSPESIEIK